MSASSGRRRVTLGVTVAATAAALAVVVPQAVTAAATPAPSPGVAAARSDHAAAYDARAGANAAEKAQLLQHRLEVQSSKAVTSARSALGSQAVLDIDGLTGTPRQVARLDGFLTAPSSASPEAVARGYLAAHPDLFRLSRAEVAGLVLSRDYADVSGVHHLSFTQRAGGLTLFGNGVKADVTKTGALVQVTGSPLPGLTAVALPAKAAVTSAAAAITVAKTDTAEKSTAPAKGDSAQQMLFRTPGSTRVAWRTVTMSASTPTLDVVDAATGRLLYRDPLADDYAAPTAPAAPAAAPQVQYANVVDNYPGAPAGGKVHPVSLNQNGWLPRGSVVLFGNNSHTYADVNDNNQADQTEEIGATGDQGYRFPFGTFKVPGEPCSTAYPCTWNPSVPNSWQANLDRTAAQNFYFINKYHDHLQAAPIGFTEAAGNFQQVNGTGAGLGGDPVVDQPLDGANTAGGLPDANHIDNANFATPPDGTAPVMQMFLWHQPGIAYPDDPFIATNGSDDADIVYHEYTHGLSHRLVVDADNVPALDSIQGGSMGEAWSDWYALDYLVNDGYFTDTSKAGEIEVGKYVIAGADNFRSEPTDCPVGSTARACPGTPAAGPGGYTYGDFGKIAGAPEVHADGEIWAQTLWDLRTALGSATSESLVTRAMELSPTLPSMLDMRNAILIADQTVFGGSHTDRLWKLFARRGMGFFAGTVTGDDTAPVEDFSLPPTAATGTGTFTGTVADSATGAPVKGARVAFGGHDSGLPGASYQAVTDVHGVFTISGVVAGTYPDVYALGGGYDLAVLPQVRISKNSTRTRNFALLRDWASSSGGGSISDFTGVDFSDFGCGPAGDIDQSGGVGWGSESDLDANSRPTAATPKYIVIALPAAVDVSGISINPSNTCGDGASAATGDYRVDVSTDGDTFTTAASGAFSTDDLGRLNPITLTGTTTGIVAVKFWMLTPQVVTRGLDCNAGAYSGCLFMDSSEVEVYGVAAT